MPASEPRIFADFPSPSETSLTDHCIELDETAFRHLIRVLRMGEGESIRLFNGDGYEYSAQLEAVSKKSAQARLQQRSELEPETQLSLHLGQVISKGDKMDFTIQKATELGIHEITPLFSERCDVRLKGERLDKKVEHWQRVAISACEQSGRNRIPKVHQPLSLAEWLNRVDADTKLILHPHNQQPLSAYSAPDSLALLVGPEGGFSEAEVLQAQQQGFGGLTLGPRILRTETAALAALSVLQYCWGDF